MGNIEARGRIMKGGEGKAVTAFGSLVLKKGRCLAKLEVKLATRDA
jgi:hypothetical protein